MIADLSDRLSALSALTPEARVDALLALGEQVPHEALSLLPAAEAEPLRALLLDLVSRPVGTGPARLRLGEMLGYVGDPRLHLPVEASYWVEQNSPQGRVVLGRFPVTNHEFRRFVASGGYNHRDFWTDEGWDWQRTCTNPWPVLARQQETKVFLVDNQPVVGVTVHEALAYAASVGARLPRAWERNWATRGADKRKYPWGEPFGEGNANTKEEVLHRPCAVGLYLRDRTPEGICDLGGNVAEWLGDNVEGTWLIHPGAWDQPSIASWAKALGQEGAASRWAALGFRLARD